MNLEVLKQVSKELEIPFIVVKEAYLSYWTFVRNTAKALPLQSDLSKEEFDKLRPNFNIPSLGKLAVTWDRYCRVKKRVNYLQKIKDDNNNKDSQTNV